MCRQNITVRPICSTAKNTSNSTDTNAISSNIETEIKRKRQSEQKPAGKVLSDFKHSYKEDY